MIPEQRPFTADTNKFAYAQAFAGPGARRPTVRPAGSHRLHWPHLARSAGKLRPADRRSTGLR